MRLEPTTDSNGNTTVTSKVIEVSGVPPAAREADVVQIGVPFGKVTNVTIKRNKNMVRYERF